MAQPDRIGKYRILSKLGEGATSTVYLGHDDFAQRDVALKLIFPEALKDVERGRLYRQLLVNEASLAGKLAHPHIVPIYDAVIDDAQSYIVMEYVPGGTLEPWCTPSTLLPIDRVVEIIFKCTRALDYAQRLGITHRDIKPANILIANAGSFADASSSEIKISDFGAAMLSGSEHTQQTQHTQSAQAHVAGVGSPAYMSPEQVQDNPVDHRTDIYSLGVVTYQLLTGRLPFQAGSNYAVAYQICNVDPAPPSTFRTDVPEGLDAIVARAMQRDLAARYQSWGEFAHDLAQAFRNKQLAAKQREFPDSEKFEILRELRFFKDFSDVEIWEVVRFSVWDLVAPHTLIMKDGEPGDSFAFLIDGEAIASKHGGELARLGAGDCVGEMAVCRRTHRVRAADVTTLTTSKIVRIAGEALRNASDGCRMRFYQEFLNVVSTRLDTANERLSKL
jgi:eukaryotic-like serine/threonine-protein kinase